MKKWEGFALYCGTKYLGVVEAETQEEAESIFEIMADKGLPSNEFITEIKAQETT